MLQVSTCSNGKYRLSQENVFISLPVELGPDGVKRIVEIDLNTEEQHNVIKSLFHFVFSKKILKKKIQNKMKTKIKNL